MIENLIYIVGPLFLVWAMYRLILPNQNWEFDWDVARATFFLLYERHFKIALTLIVFDVLTIFASGNGGVRMMCLDGALYAAGYVVWVILKYEVYLHARYPRTGLIGDSPYTTSQYALTRALAALAVVLSLGGMVMAVIG